MPRVYELKKKGSQHLIDKKQGCPVMGSIKLENK